MIRFYLMRIGNGAMTLEEVPNLWHAKVEKELKQLD